jgi:DNA repair exonuclease SbcCD nuclease subunit
LGHENDFRVPETKTINHRRANRKYLANRGLGFKVFAPAREQGEHLMAATLKFIHASDLHLDRPMSGLTEIPTHLYEVLANAPYEAAKKVFDLAVSERVDFVLLAGDLYNSELGNARAAAFLLSQFERLADKDINVYWCGGETDHPDRWPAAIELPDNVVTFSSRIVEEVNHEREGEPVARIMGCGYDAKSRRTAGDFSAPNSELFTIALAHGDFDIQSLKAENVKYWALGGNHKASKHDRTSSTVVYSGTPQGRSPKESGAHGFKLGRIDAAGKLRLQTVESDRVRWLPQKVAISEGVEVHTLKKELTERAAKIVADTTDQIVLARWTLATEGMFNPAIRKREWSEQILEWLRDEFGRGDKGLWSVSLDVAAPKQLPSDWYEEDTILGEFMRAIGRYQSDDSLRLNLHEYTPTNVEGTLTSGMSQVSQARREEILRRAAMVGIDYLAAHKHYGGDVDEVQGTETVEATI